MENIELEGCEAEEIAIERRAAGGLAPDERAHIEIHLETCVSCQRYAEQLERMQVLIRVGNETVQPARSWPRVNKYVVRREEVRSRKMSRSILLGMAFMALPLLVAMSEGDSWLVLPASAFMFMGAVQLVMLLVRQRHLAQLAEVPRDVLTLVRRELALKRLLVSLGLVVSIFAGVILMATGLESAPVWIPTLGFRQGGALYLGMAALSFALAIYLSLVTRPRLGREAADLA